MCSKNCPSDLRDTDKESRSCLGHRPESGLWRDEIVATDLLADIMV